MYLYKTTIFPHQPLRSVSKVAVLHRLAKLHDMYLYKTDNFFHINHYLKSVSKGLSYTGFTVEEEIKERDREERGTGMKVKKQKK